MTDSTTVAIQASQVIDVLATKFKVPSQFLFQVLKRQGLVDFVQCAVFFGFVLVIDFFLYKRWIREHTKEKEDTRERYYDEDVFGAISRIIAAVVTIIGFVVFLSSTTGVINPDYYALHQILEVFNSK